MTGRIGLGLQLYTLRSVMEQDFVGALRKVSEMGYEGVEFAGYGGMNASELKDLLVDLNVKAVSAHVDLYTLRDRLEETVEFHNSLGSEYVVCPWVPEELRKTESDWLSVFHILERAGQAFREAGIGFGYHNHGFEFETQINGQFVFDAMFAATSPENVKVQLDVCWAQDTGHDPAAYIRKYAGRIPLIHIKDLQKTETGESLTVPLGEGIVDLESVISASKDAGVAWFIVEQDYCQRSPLESVSDSLTWLREHYIP